MMRSLVLNSLTSALDSAIALQLVDSYEKLIAEYRKGDAEAALNESGKFVEHALRAIEYLRTKTVLTEIKSVVATVKELEKDRSLPESLRLLVPRVSSAMMFDVRSKRGAAHVKEISPQQIDAALAAQAASWIMSEFVRLYHVGAESDVAAALAALTRSNLPLIEQFGDERVVTALIDLETEILLQLFAAEPGGLSRSAVGSCLQQQPSTVSKAIKRLQAARFVHVVRSGDLRITGPGERFLTERLGELSADTRIRARS